MPRIIKGRSVMMTVFDESVCDDLMSSSARAELSVQRQAQRVRAELQKSASTTFMQTTMMPIRQAVPPSPLQAAAVDTTLNVAAVVTAIARRALPPEGVLLDTDRAASSAADVGPQAIAAAAAICASEELARPPRTKRRRRTPARSRRTRRKKDHALRYIESHDDEEYAATGRHMYSVMWAHGGLGAWVWDVECLFPGVGMRHPLIVAYHRAHPLRQLDARIRPPGIVTVRRSNEQNRESDAAIRRWVTDTAEPRSRDERPACAVIVHVSNETGADVFYGADCVGRGAACTHMHGMRDAAQ